MTTPKEGCKRSSTDDSALFTCLKKRKSSGSAANVQDITGKERLFLALACTIHQLIDFIK